MNELLKPIDRQHWSVAVGIKLTMLAKSFFLCAMLLACQQFTVQGQVMISTAMAITAE